MKKFLALAAVVLGLASCQTEPEGLDVVVGGEQDVNITVSLPEGTRANSALGAFENVDLNNDYDVRFQCEVHYGDQVKVLPVQISDNGKSATFPVRLIANRNYTFVVWADLVEQGSTADLHYNTANGLDQIEIKDWKAMDETRDAYTCSEVREFKRNANIRLELTRPFAKLRVITTDMLELMGVTPTWAKVEYTTPYYTSFNAYEQKPGDLSSGGKKHSELFDIVSYGESGASKTLFTDYFFATNPENGQAPETVAFTMEVFDENGATIDEPKSFNTSIPVKRNYLTTIKGNILTYADDFTVTIDDAFENAQNPNDAPYYQAAVTNGADLLTAIAEGREVIALNDITVTAADANFEEGTTRSTTGINPVLNLNGFTITIENNGAEALVDLQGGVLTVEGNGAIESTTGALVETIYNVGEATIAEKAATEPVVNCLSEIRAAFANGGEYTMVCDLAISESLTLATGKELVFNLNGKTLTGTDTITDSFGLITNNGNLTITGNGKMTLKAKNNRGWNAYSSVISNNPGGKLVVENGTIEHLGGTDMAYGIDNLTNGKGTYAETEINGGTIKSTYRAVRMFLNGIEAQNLLTVNGGIIEGANKSIWMQDPSKNANTGKLVVKADAELKGDAYLSVTAGSTEWPVEVSIANDAFVGKSTLLSNNVPAGYEVVEKDGVWTVVAYTKVANGLYKKDAKTYLVMNADGLVALSGMDIENGEIVTLGADIDLTGVEFNGLEVQNWVGKNTFDGQNHTISNWTYEGGASDMGFIRQWIGPVKNVKFENCHLKTAGRSAVVAGKIYGNIDNVSVNNCSIVDSYWACGIIAGLYNAGSVSNCTVTNSSVKSNGGTAAIVGVFNEEGGERGLKNCSVSNTTINNTGVYGDVYTGGALVGMFNVNNATFTIEGCAVSNNTLEGGYVYEKYPADESVTIIEK